MPGGCFINQVYQISKAYFSNSELFSLDLVSERKSTITPAQSLWQLLCWETNLEQANCQAKLSSSNTDQLERIDITTESLTYN